MVYLDNSATTRARDEVICAVDAAMRGAWFNPSALYAEALSGEKALEDARNTLLKSLGNPEGRIVFTCGGTDGDNLALTGSANAAPRTRRHIVTTAVEHPAILKTVEFLCTRGFEATILPVDPAGAVSAEAVCGALRADTLMVSVMHVNNESGAVNDIAGIARAVKEKDPSVLFHSDGVQAYLRVPADLRDVDLYTLSGHKVHAPKGTGALYVRDGVRLTGVQTGGGQEYNLRSGTQNVPGIVGLARAVALWTPGDAARIRAMKNALLAGVFARVDDVRVNGPEPDAGAPHILNLGFSGVRAETLLHALEETGVLVATGSACASHKKKISAVLMAMRVPEAYAEGAIRLSLGALNTMDEMDEAARAIGASVAALRRFRRR